MSSQKFGKKIKSLVKVTAMSSVFANFLLYYRNDEKYFNNIFMPASRYFLGPEKAQKFSIFLCKWSLIPKNDFVDTPMLATTLSGVKLKNVIGLAAGYDKDGEAIKSLHKMGFGFIELGTVKPDEEFEEVSTLLLPEEGVIFNSPSNSSKGHSFIVPKMRVLRRREEYKEIIGLNIGRNTKSNYVNDISMNVKVFSPTANYLAINIDSIPLTERPNDDLRKKENLRELLKEVNRARRLFDEEKQRPIFLKLSPDLTENELKDIVEVTREKNCTIHGFIISNSTLDRDFNLESKYNLHNERLSGKPLREKSTKMIEIVYKLTSGKVAIVGGGGIFTGRDAYEKILAGASALQIYSSFVLSGPPVVNKIKRELAELLANDGYNNVGEAVGAGIKLERGWRKWVPFLR